MTMDLQKAFDSLNQIKKDYPKDYIFVEIDCCLYEIPMYYVRIYKNQDKISSVSENLADAINRALVTFKEVFKKQ